VQSVELERGKVLSQLKLTFADGSIWRFEIPRANRNGATEVTEALGGTGSCGWAGRPAAGPSGNRAAAPCSCHDCLMTESESERGLRELVALGCRILGANGHDD